MRVDPETVEVRVFIPQASQREYLQRSEPHASTHRQFEQERT